MLNCAVIGATGYTGVELIKILLRHRYARISALTTRQEAMPVQKLIPSLSPDVDIEVRNHSLTELKRSSDLFFLCLPHTGAMETAGKLCRAGKIVIDLSADFRLRDAAVYEKWYKVKHTNPEMLAQSVYGLPEFFRREIKGAHLIANPGCYPTAVVLALAPLLRKGLIEKRGLVIDAKSGVSGAGKKLNPSTQYFELDENFYAYRVGRHQHTPEIGQLLSGFGRGHAEFTFVTHLLPVMRGILCTVYARLRKKADAAAVDKALREAYEREPFIRFLGEERFPALRDVQHTNYCDIGYHMNRETGRLIIVSAIDNLLKGASGQAVQNMNICMGFPEEEGLTAW